MDKFKIGDKVNFVVERSLLSGVITKFYKNTYNEEECSIKTEIKTFPHILLQRVSKINDEDDLIKQIADLEAKLAESKQETNDWKQRFESSEERFKTFNSNGVIALNLKNEKIEKLKQQLEESDSYKLRIELAGADEEIARLREENEKLKTEIEEIKKLKEIKND